MSEYEPITAELRNACGDANDMVSFAAIESHDFDRLCDAIDAVHAGLERENAELRERVAVLDNADRNMHDGGSITGELREFARRWPSTDYVCKDMLAIADRIEVEHENAMAAAALIAGVPMTDEHMAEHGWVRLPLDADGVPINAGDVLDGYGKTIEVVEMRHGRSGWVLISRDGNGYADTFAFSHHRAPTVEDVLREFAYGLGVPVADSYVAATAAKLRLADGKDA